jgi:hypothetical protein
MGGCAARGGALPVARAASGVFLIAACGGALPVARAARWRAMGRQGDSSLQRGWHVAGSSLDGRLASAPKIWVIDGTGVVGWTVL